MVLFLHQMQVLPEQLSLLNEFKEYLHNPLRNIQSAYKAVMVCTNLVSRVGYVRVSNVISDAWIWSDLQ